MTNINMIFIANWKMNGEKKHISDIYKTIHFSKKSKNKKIKIVYCPPYTLISKIRNKVKNTNIKVGAQNIHYINDYGAFTGLINSKLRFEKIFFVPLFKLIFFKIIKSIFFRTV